MRMAINCYNDADREYWRVFKALVLVEIRDRHRVPCYELIHCILRRRDEMLLDLSPVWIRVSLLHCTVTVGDMCYIWCGTTVHKPHY